MAELDDLLAANAALQAQLAAALAAQADLAAQLATANASAESFESDLAKAVGALPPPPSDLASLQAQLAALNGARAKGVSVVTYSSPAGGTRSVTYKSDREMNAAAQDLQRRIAAMSGGGRRVTYVDSSKGLRSTREFPS